MGKKQSRHLERIILRCWLQSNLGQGKKCLVLDAGCGPGSFAALLVENGATVLAIDSSPEMVYLAKQNLGDSATVMKADLNDPLDFIESDSFDVVLSSLTLDYIEDWDALFREFFRILNDSGRLVISIHHPFFMDLKNNQAQIAIEKNYFLVQSVEENWAPTGMGIPSYRRPLSAISNAFWNAGFLMERPWSLFRPNGCAFSQIVRLYQSELIVFGTKLSRVQNAIDETMTA